FSSVEPPPEIRTPSLIGRARAAGTGRKGVMLVTLAPGYATSVGQGYQLSRAGCGATDRVGILRPREIVAGGRRGRRSARAGGAPAVESAGPRISLGAYELRRSRPADRR